MIDILAITAHPDDLEVGIAGIMLKAKNAGKKLGLIVCTRGESGGFAEQSTRVGEQEKAVKLLGLDYFKHLDFPDAGVRFGDELINALIPLVREAAPEVVITLHPDDYHPDHVAVSRSVNAVTFVAGLKKHSTDDTTWHPKEVLYFTADFRTNGKIPDILVNIDDVADKKIELCNAHVSQNITEFTMGIGKFLGSLAGCSYAEGLYRRQPLVLNKIDGLFV